MKLNHFFLLFLLFFFSVSLLSARQDSTEVEKLLIAVPNIGPLCDFAELNEVYDAAGYAIDLGKQYKSIPKNMVNREIQSRNQVIQKINLAEIAKELGAGYIVFPRVNRIGNVLRTEMIIKSISDSTKKRGVGYAALNYRDLYSDEVIYVPSLINAFQRSFAGALSDTMLYDKYRNAYRVYPAPAVAICGVEFEKSVAGENSRLFKDKQSASYDLVETVFKVSSLKRGFFTFDIETRDSIYKMFRLFEKMNFRAPSKEELRALQAFEIRYFISGKFSAEDSGNRFRLELMLFELHDAGKTKKIRSHVEYLEEETPEAFRYIVKKTALKLLYGEDVEVPDYVPPAKDDR